MLSPLPRQYPASPLPISSPTPPRAIVLWRFGRRQPLVAVRARSVRVLRAPAGKTWSSWVWQWRGSSGLGNSASQFTTTKTVSLTPAFGADSAVIWTVGDFQGSVTPTATPTTPNETTRQAINNALYDIITADITDQTSAGAVSYGLTTTSAGPFSIAVVEIKGTSSGAAAAGFNKRKKLEKLGI
jgi:hypothetical protein